jgi:PIN domain nuclease of toxin-antitoxin system
MVLPVLLTHVLGLEDLPRHHGDPFDRMLISQARAEAMQLVSADEAVRAYPPLVDVLW